MLVEQVTLQTIGVMIAASSVVIGVVNNILSNRRAEKSKQIDLFNRFYMVRSNEEWWRNLIDLLYVKEWDDFEDWREIYSANKNAENLVSWANLMSYFNSMGYLVKSGELDVDTVASNMHSAVVSVWEKVKTIVYEYRRRYSQERADADTLYVNVEYLYNEMVKWRETNISKLIMDLK